jgi:hypothetical protein
LPQRRSDLISNSCADWEDDALIELDSFALVEVTVDGMSCAESGTTAIKLSSIAGHAST